MNTGEGPGSGDLVGLRPYGEAVKIGAETACKFLEAICLPAAEQFGYLLGDNVERWRSRNVLSLLAKTQEKLLEGPGPEARRVHPRMAAEIIEKASWNDDDEVQAMWAGLLASSCTDDGNDQSNQMFVDILRRLSPSQVRLLNYLCCNTAKAFSPSGAVLATGRWKIAFSIIKDVTGLAEAWEIDRDIDHMFSLGLLTGTLPPSRAWDEVELHPSALALNLYVRAQGTRASPKVFFGVTEPVVKPKG